MDKYVVTREEIDAHEGVSKTHFLNDNARRINKSLGDLTGLTGIGFHVIEVEPGRESTELHRHHHEDECVYILSGEAEATIGHATYSVKSGDLIGYRAGGEAHRLKNTGRVSGASWSVSASTTTSALRKKRPYRNKGMKWNVVDFENVAEPDASRKR